MNTLKLTAVRPCEHCRRPFTPRPGERMCSDECRRAHANAAKAAGRRGATPEVSVRADADVGEYAVTYEALAKLSKRPELTRYCQGQYATEAEARATARALAAGGFRAVRVERWGHSRDGERGTEEVVETFEGE